MMDNISELRLSEVCPTLASKIGQLSDALIAQGTAIRVTDGLRSWNKQSQLYQQGRSTPGKIVTNAPPGFSWHEFGLAVDLVPMDPLPDWNEAHPVWQIMIAAAKSIGLYSGSQFVHIKDEPHVQLTGTYPVTPNNDARAVLAHVGLQGVWVEAGLISGGTT